jgi:hypothetical protein
VGLFLVGGAVFFYMRAKVEIKPKTTLIAQIQFELDDTTKMKNVVSINAHGPPEGDDEGPLDVTVDYYASPPAVQRAALVKDTNMVVRRHIPNIAEVVVNFADTKPPGALSDAGGFPIPTGPAGPTVIADPNAVPGASGPGTKPTVTVTPDKPKNAGSGLVTIVTFPEAYVEEGSSKLGKTPLFKVKMPAGTHMLKLTGTDGVSHRLSVPVVANQTKVFKVKLDELPTK